jgi:hypothetical protein
MQTIAFLTFASLYHPRALTPPISCEVEADALRGITLSVFWDIHRQGFWRAYTESGLAWILGRQMTSLATEQTKGAQWLRQSRHHQEWPVLGQVLEWRTQDDHAGYEHQLVAGAHLGYAFQSDPHGPPVRQEVEFR